MDPVVGGGIVAVGAFALATARDELTRRRDRRRQERSVLTAILEEIAANKQTATNNRELVRHELNLLDEGQRLLNPLDPLELGFWDLVKINPPEALISDLSAIASA